MLYQHPEYEASIAAERYRHIRESFLNAPRLERPHLLRQAARLLGLSFVRLGRGLLRYGVTKSQVPVVSSQ